MNILTEERFEQILTEKLDKFKSSISKKEKPPSLDYEWLSNETASKALGISSRLMQDWRRDGKISYVQIQQKLWYKRVDIEKILLDNYHKAINPIRKGY